MTKIDTEVTKKTDKELFAEMVWRLARKRAPFLEEGDSWVFDTVSLNPTTHQNESREKHLQKYREDLRAAESWTASEAADVQRKLKVDRLAIALARAEERKSVLCRMQRLAQNMPIANRHHESFRRYVQVYVNYQVLTTANVIENYKREIEQAKQEALDGAKIKADAIVVAKRKLRMVEDDIIQETAKALFRNQLNSVLPRPDSLKPVDEDDQNRQN